MNRQNRPNIIARPDKTDLSQSMDNLDTTIDKKSLLAQRPTSEKDSQIGIHFIERFYLNNVPKRQKTIACKPQRLKKW